MENMGEETAAKFINALIKSVQTLCHGYLDFQTGIEIIGHINLSVDKGTSLDYILKEKVCKNAENSTLFISDSFHAEPKPDHREAEKNSQSSNQVINHHNAVEPAESGMTLCALDHTTQIVTGQREISSGNSGVKNSHPSHHPQSTAKRRARSEDQCIDFIPAKILSHVDSMSHFSDDSSFLTGPPSPLDSKEAVQALSGMSKLMPLQTPDMTTDCSADTFGNVQKASGDENGHGNLNEEYSISSEEDLSVTFVKAEHVGSEESEQSTGQQHGVRNPFLKGSHDLGAAGQQYSSGSSGPSTSQPQPGPSGITQRESLWSKPGLRVNQVHHDYHGHADTLDQSKPSYHQVLSLAWSLRHYDKTAKIMGEPRGSGRFKTSSTGRGIKTFSCDFCSATFASSSGLRSHKSRVHFNTLPYWCSICGKGFTKPDNYQGHMNMHNNISAFKCPHCSKRYPYKTSLNTHLRSGKCQLNKARKDCH